MVGEARGARGQPDLLGREPGPCEPRLPEPSPSVGL